MGNFIAMARILSHLGDQLISNSTVAILELIKNAYDATINKENGYVKIQINQVKRTMTIEDNGHGMTHSDIKNKYLVIGTTDRLVQKNQIRKEKIKGKEISKGIPQGEKGLGRFATMKLGEKVVLLTKSEKSEDGCILGLNWNAFGYSSNKQLSEVKSHEFLVSSESLMKKKYNNSFTKIRIYDLKDFVDPLNWTPKEFADLYKKHFLKFLNPFKPTKGFQIKLEVITANSEIHRFTPENIDSKLLDQAPYKIKGVVRGNRLKFLYYIKGKDQNFYKGLHSTVITQVTEKDLSEDGYMGPFKFELYFYDRTPDRLKEIKGYENITRIRELLNQYCGGTMIYRDNFRVLPYAEPGNDWLEVNTKSQFQSSGIRFNTLQTVGTIYINSINNPNFRDQTNREGLVRNKAYENLYTTMRFILSTYKQVIEKYYPKPKRTRGKITSADELDYAFKPFEENISRIEDNLNKIKLCSKFDEMFFQNSIKILNKNFENLNNDYEKVKNCVVDLNAKVGEVEKQQNLIIDLAGVGMTAESVAHEMRSYLSRIKNYLEVLKKSCPSEKDKILSLISNTKSLEATVSRLDIQTVARRRVRSKVNLVNIIKGITTSKSNVWNNNFDQGINISIQFNNDCYIKANEGMIIQVFDNLLNNSHYWLLKHRENYPKANLDIYINIDDSGIVEFYDNGFGIVELDTNSIFEPFFTRRRDGRGLGLYIIQEALNFHDADIYLSKNDRNRYGNYYKFVMDFSKCVVE